VSDYLLNFVNKGVSLVTGLLVSVILARFLGVHLRGELAFITQTAAIGGIMLGFGVNQAFIFYFRQSRSYATFRDTVGLLLWQMGALAVLATVATWIVNDPTFGYIAALAVSLAFYQQLEGVMTAYNIRLKIRVNMAYAVTRLAAYLVMWPLASEGLWWPVAISVATCLLAVVLYLCFAVEGPPGRPTYDFAKSAYAFGWLPMLTTLLVVLNYSVDIVMIKAFGTSEGLGLYAVAAGIVTYLWVGPDAIKEVLVSRVVRTNDPRAVLRPLRAALIVGWISVLAVATLGAPLIPLLFGGEYAGAYVLVLILSLGVVAMTYYKILGVAVLAEGKRVFYFAALATAVALNLLLNWWVIPVYGAVGASWVSVVTYSITGALFTAYFSRVFHIPLRELMVIGRREDIVALGQVLRRRA